MTADGKTCKKKHPCDLPTKGGCDQTCNKEGDKAVCSCTAPEYKLGADGKSCEKGTSVHHGFFVKFFENTQVILAYIKFQIFP